MRAESYASNPSDRGQWTNHIWSELVENIFVRQRINKKITTDLESVLYKHKEIFRDELGTLKSVLKDQVIY